MGHASCIGRLGMLAAGLSIGAALACTPGVASADSSPFGLTPTELADIDQILRDLFDPTGADMQVSINGMELFPTVGNTATASSGMGDIAVAIGNGANADSAGGGFIIPLGGGFGDLAIADGTNSTADAGLLGGSNLDFVFADGANSFANAELGANLDTATAVNGGTATVGVGDMFDTALANGTNSNANVGLGNYDLALANGANSIASTGVGNGDLASAANGGDANSGGFLATAFADGASTLAKAQGVLDTAIVSGTNATGCPAICSEADAVNGINDFASVVNTGSAQDIAVAGGTGAAANNNDIAEIFGTGSTAFAGSDPTTSGGFDLAVVFGDMLHAIATGGNFLVDIPPLPLF